MNICRNNADDIRQLTEYAHDYHFATDYHINETPMLEQDQHFKHLNDNPTYIRPEDWCRIDQLIDWIIEKNRAGYQMVNSVQRLREMKAFVRMSSGLDIHKVGWYGDGTGTDDQLENILARTPGIVRGENGDVHFADWNCRAGQNNVVFRTDGTITPCFPMYSATSDWGNIDSPKFDQIRLRTMKENCQRHCFSTLNHNLGYCYNDARVIKFVWKQAENLFQGRARSFED
jgi:radical SAM protein with 4Fe4S-binding SPASM domain